MTVGELGWERLEISIMVRAASFRSLLAASYVTTGLAVAAGEKVRARIAFGGEEEPGFATAEEEAAAVSSPSIDFPEPWPDFRETGVDDPGQSGMRIAFSS